MFKTVPILLCITAAVCAAEVSSSYALLEKTTAFRPDLKTEPVDVHAVFKKDNKPDAEHPVYKADERKNEGRAHIMQVRPAGPVVKHDMLADQPMPTEVNRIDNLAIPGYGFVPAPMEVAYPDVAYAPGYGYDAAYGPSNNYDVYGNGPSNYELVHHPSLFSLLWSQVPDSRTLVNYAGRTFVWIVNSFLVLIVGSILTIGVCSYTNICTITVNGIGPIHEEMRSLVTPERLEKIGNAADFVKNAIDKYQKIQKVADVAGQMN